MIDSFTNTQRRELKVDWAKDKGPIDMRYHSMGIGGVHSMPAPQLVVDSVAALKPSFIRIFLQEFFYIYPDHGVFDWSKMDAYMDAVHAMGGDIMASICIKPNVLYPIVDESVSMPNNVEEWQNVIKAMVLRYSKEKPYVTHWAIGNETNIGELGGCPYLITCPDVFYEYYKITAEAIREVLPPEIKVGGPSYAGGDQGAAKYLARVAELCKMNNVPLDFTCYNAYHDNPGYHVGGGRIIRDAIDKHDPSIKLYMTEFNVSLVHPEWDLSLEETAYNPKRAASLAMSILDLHEDGCLDGSFQYHIYDQFCDPREFAPWYSRHRYMAEHWNDLVHRLGLLDLDGKTRPQYFMYDLLYSMTGKRVELCGTDGILKGFASTGDDKMSVFLTNFAERGGVDLAAMFQFENACEGIYRLKVYKIDETAAAQMKTARMTELPPAEDRIVYVHPDFHFHVYIPAGTVALVRLEKI